MSDMHSTEMEGTEAGQLPTDAIVVRALQDGDLSRLVRIDQATTGQARTGYYEKRLKAALEDTGVQVSLAAEVDGCVVGFVLGRVYEGEYGSMDAFATVDTLGVAPEFRGRGVGRALLGQLVKNLQALRVERLETTVDWEQGELMAFLRNTGFRPAARLCLERSL